MNKLFKNAVLFALVSPSLSFAADLLDGNTAAATGSFEIQGDGGAGGGGVGWNNTNNTLFNEMDIQFETSGEVYAGVGSSKAIAYARAVHMGGKGTVFTNTSFGFSGVCVEDTAAQAAFDRTSTTAELISATLTVTDGTLTGTFVNSITAPNVTTATPDRSYSLTGCTQPG